jgi:hypothetical protein
MKYKVISNRFSGAELGSTLTEEDLVGCNVGALIEGGHLSVVSSRAVKAAASAEADEADTEES